MRLKLFSCLFLVLLAIALFAGGVTGVSVAEGVYLPLNGVSEYVYSPTSTTKGLSDINAINKNVTIKFGKDNYLLYGDGISGTGIEILARDTVLPTNNSSNLNGCFSESYSVSDSTYVDHNGDWIIQSLSLVYTVIPTETPIDDVSVYNGVWDSGYSIVSPSKITLKYDQNMSDTYDSLAVLYRVDDNSPWDILPCVVNTSSKTVTTTFSQKGFGSYCIVNMDGNFREFSGTGISGVNWSQQYVMALWTKGIMSQTRDNGYFGLVDDASQEYNTTRGEFASMLVKGLRLPMADKRDDIFSDLNSVLQDVSKTPNITYDNYYPHWRDYAYTSSRYGIFNGIRNETSGDPNFGKLEFRPNDPITREQAAALIARAAKLKLETDNEDGGVVDKALAKLYKNDLDYQTISRWARPYVLAVTKAKYMIGIPDPDNSKNKLFNAQGDITRAQAAKTIYMLLKNLKLI